MIRKSYFAALTAFLVILVIFAAVMLSSGRRGNTTEELLSLGERFLIELEFEQALVHFMQVIEIDPMNVQAYIGTAQAYIGLEQKNNAINILRLGIERTGNLSIAWAWINLDPYSSQSYLNIAELFMSISNIDAAIEVMCDGLLQTGCNDIREKLYSLGVYDPDEMLLYEMTDSINNQEPFGLTHLQTWGLLPSTLSFDLQEVFDIDINYLRNARENWGVTFGRYQTSCCGYVEFFEGGNRVSHGGAIDLNFDNHDRITRFHHTAHRFEGDCIHGFWPFIPMGTSLIYVLEMFRNDSLQALEFTENNIQSTSDIILYSVQTPDSYFSGTLSFPTLNYHFSGFGFTVTLTVIFDTETATVRDIIIIYVYE